MDRAEFLRIITKKKGCEFCKNKECYRAGKDRIEACPYSLFTLVELEKSRGRRV